MPKSIAPLTDIQILNAKSRDKSYKLMNKCRSTLLLAAISISMSGCHAPRLTYQDVMLGFKDSCPSDPMFKGMNAQSTQKICACMHETILERWPDLGAFHKGLHDLDREPRDYPDFLRGGVRMTVKYCMKAPN